MLRKTVFIAFAIFAALVFTQDVTGRLLGRWISLNPAARAAQEGGILALGGSRQLPAEERLRRQVVLLEDGRRISGPHATLSKLRDMAEPAFAIKNQIYVRPSTDPAGIHFTAWIPRALPGWMRWLAFGGLLAWLLPWTIRRWRETAPRGAKQVHLESIRGVACLAVVATHVTMMLFPDVENPDLTGKQWHHIESLHRHVPGIRMLTGGEFAVLLFFVLSGFVLSLPFAGKPSVARGRILAAALRRPLRLAGVVMAVMLVMHLLRHSGVIHANLHQAPVATSQFLWDLTRPLGDASLKYNPVFWTIHCELWGSFGVYAFWLLAGGRKWRWLLYPAALALWRGNAYQAFVFGVLLADCAPAFAKWAESGRHAWASTLLVVLGVMFGGYAEADELRGGYERALQGLLPDLRGVFCSGCRLIGAVLLMAGVLGGIWWQRVLSGSWGSHLGRLSYSIYGIHGPIQITLMAPLIAWLHPMADIRTPFVPDGGGYALAVAVALLVYLPAVWFCSALLTVAVDEPCTRLARRFSDGVMGWWKMGR